MESPKNMHEKGDTVDAPVLSANQHVVDATRAEADVELAQTHEVAPSSSDRALFSRS